MALRLTRLPKGWDQGTAKGKGRFAVAPKYERTLDGVVFDSKGEMQRWAILKMNERAGAIFNLRRQVDFPIRVNDLLICIYKADFVYQDAEGGQEIVEDWKSSGTRKERSFVLVKKLLKAVHDIDLVVTTK